MSTISAGTTSTTTLIHSGDTTGSLVLKTNDTGSGGTTAVTIDTSQNVGIGTTTSLSKLTALGASSTVTNGASTRSPVASIRGGNDNNRLDVYVDNSGGTAIMGLGAYNVSGGATAMTFYTGASVAEAMRIDSSGNVGIGTSSPSYKLDVRSTLAVLDGSSNIGFYANGSTYTQIWQTLQSTNDFIIQTTASKYISFGINSAEKVRIDTSGIVLVGATSARTTQAKIELTSAANTALSFYMYKTSQVEMAMGFKSSTDTNFYIGTGSTSVGTNGVYLTNTGSSWNAVSDERMKTILEPITNAAEKVSSLRAVIGYYNNDESQIRRPFLIAQDVQKVLPEAVNVQDQETGTLGMSYTDTIPLLVAAIKEQQALIQQLQADVAALKGTS